MIDVALSLVALIGAGVSLELFAASPAAAPLSDDVGLYLISDASPNAEEAQIGNPS